VADGRYDPKFTAYDGPDGKEVLGTESRSAAVFGGSLPPLSGGRPGRRPVAGKGAAYVDVAVGEANSSRVEVGLTGVEAVVSPFRIRLELYDARDPPDPRRT
jgi:hypothetical protein